MVDNLANLRQEKQFSAALDLLIGNCQSVSAAQATALVRRLRWHLLRRCLVLEWAVQEFREQRRSKCLPLLDRVQQHIAAWLGPVTMPVREQFDARLGLIRAAVEDKSANDALRDPIIACIEATETAWSYSPCRYITDSQSSDFAATPQDNRNGPLFLWDLKDRHRDLFQSLAKQYGWLHPGLLLAGETLAQLEGVAPAFDHRVGNHVMLTCEAGADSLGLLAPLKIERISDGRGFLIPDAFSTAYLQMQGTFSLGLQHAWYAWRLSAAGRPACDLRWQLDLDYAIRKTMLATQLNLPLHGHSAEGVLTCGFRAAAQGQQLDRNTTMTARLALPIQASLALEQVDGIDLKCLDPQFLVNKVQFKERLRRRHIDNVIVAHLQPKEDYDTGGTQRFIPVRSISKAEEEFQLWPTITREVKKALAEQALQHRLNLCGPEPASKEERKRIGCSYVQSPVAYRPTRQSEAEEKLIPLDEEATLDFVLGRWRPADAAPNSSIRLRLFADSGMGKSVQLVACEHRIAEQPGEMVPIRIGKSDTHRVQLVGSTSIQSIDWGTSDEEILKSLVRNCLAKAYPQHLADKATEWIERKAQNGELVFLVDALDQSSGNLEQLAKFLSRFPQCPVIAAGRPEAMQTRFEIFGQEQWYTLAIQPLQRTQQRELLGTDLASELVLPEGVSSEADFFANLIWRNKYECRELLSNPLLLQLIKRTMNGKSNSDQHRRMFDNRYDLYQRAISELIKKGLETYRNIEELTSNSGTYEPILQSLALSMHRHGNFTQHLEGEAFWKWLGDLRNSKPNLTDLVQLNVLTMHTFTDPNTKDECDGLELNSHIGIEWRHLSFQEFFAAKELRRMWMASGRDRQEVRCILTEVHSALSETGDIYQQANSNFQYPSFENRDQPGIWRWTFRFLLCALEGLGRNDLARVMVELGNPWVIYESISEDRLKFSNDIEQLVRWLVQLHCGDLVDYSDATGLNDFTVEDAGKSLRESGVNIERMLDPSVRDPAWLSPLRELVGNTVICGCISKESSSLDRISNLQGSANSPWNFFESFVNVSGGKFTPADYEHQNSNWKQITKSVIRIPNISIADFPVTNELFELFAPTHKRMYDQHSHRTDQPVVYVSWYMASEFCYWISTLTGRHFRLLSEWEWEWAYRWLSGRRKLHCNEVYWWGGEVDHSLCWHRAQAGSGLVFEHQRTRSRQEAIIAHANAAFRHPSWVCPERPGLLDLSGNVWEWCGNPRNESSSSRSQRGGSWKSDASDCRCASHGHMEPKHQSCAIGFRLCCE